LSCAEEELIDDKQIYPSQSQWNALKCVYLFCRYYPLAVAPFHFWGFIADHDSHLCASYYHALYISILPTVRTLMTPDYSFFMTVL